MNSNDYYHTSYSMQKKTCTQTLALQNFEEFYQKKFHIDGLVQDCSNSSEFAMELLQSCTKPSIYIYKHILFTKKFWIPDSTCYFMMEKLSSLWKCHHI